MKKIVLLTALFLGAGLLAQAQTFNINAASGTIKAVCSNPGLNEIIYADNVNATWNVNIGQSKYVKIEYNLNIEPNYDYIEIYSTVPSAGYSSFLCRLTGTSYGTIYSHNIPNGNIKIVFITDGSVSCGNGWTGFNIAFSADDRTLYGSAVFQGQVNFGESVNGSLQGRALRIQTNHGNLDLGPQNADFAHLSTDRGGFLFNKPLYLQSGHLRSYMGEDLHLGTYGSAYRMTILNSNGNVGIGTTVPNTKLDVQGSVYLPSGNSYWIGSYSDSGNRLRMHHNGSTAYIDYAPTLYIRSGTNTVASFLNNGNVGIGTENPNSGYKLVVNGDIGVGLGRGNDNIPVGYAGKIDFNPYENTDIMWIARYNKAADQSELRVNIGDDGGANDRFAVGYTNGSGWNEKFAVLASGNVGIGVPNPIHKLEVDGVIRAKDIKVCLTTGCDYVFADDYNLMNLSDLSKFIKTNKHLPDVAPAREMEAEGINLSDMNTLLLKKVEELTLYLLEQNKAIENLQKKNEELENRINNLK